MEKRPEFHGSDLEKIAEYYQIPQSEIVLFGANVNPLGLSRKAKEELTANLDIITRYPDREYTSLKNTIASYCHTDPEYVVVGNGSTELISLLISCRAPEKVLILGPTYSEYARESALAGGHIVSYLLHEETDFQLDMDDFLTALTPDTDLLILCNPNNPTSSAICTKQLDQILEFCADRDIFVMIDETYVEFAPDVSQITALPLVRRYDNLMIIRGVSKFFAAPGLRFGYGVTSSRQFQDTLLSMQNPWSLNSIGAFLGEIFLTDTEYIARTRSLIGTERSRMYQELSKLSAYKLYPSFANFQLVRICREGLTSFQLFESAIQRKLMIRDCSSFESLKGEYIRFCHMLPEDNDRLLDCLKEAASGF